MIVDRYFYGKLPDNEKQIYREIYQGCMAHQDVIPVSSIENEDAKSYLHIIQAIMDDNPLLYFLNQSSMDLAQDANGNYAVLPQYFFSQETVTNYNLKIQDAVNAIIYELKLTEGNDLDKVRKVHDYMCRKITYDYDGANINDVSRFIAAHNIIGVFAHRKAQCEGIAKATKVLLNAVDIRCIVLFGEAADETGKMMNHAWNIVNINGKAYHEDITFDIGTGKTDMISYDYYNITDAQIRKDHIFSIGYPKCTDKSYGYFEQENLIFSSKKQIQNHIVKQVRNGSSMLYFKLSGKLRAATEIGGLLEYALKILSDNGVDHVSGYHMVNDSMNTCRLYFGNTIHGGL